MHKYFIGINCKFFVNYLSNILKKTYGNGKIRKILKGGEYFDRA